MPFAMQQSFIGPPQMTGDNRKRAEYILQTYPEARNDYRLAIFWWWMEFDSLGDILGDRADAFREWFVSQGTSPQTVRNRTQEVQNWRRELEASPEVEAVRQRQRNQGPVL